MKKIALCWIGVGKYNDFFQDFYRSFKDHFCTECSRDFFIFTDKPQIMEGLDDCIIYTISHACHHVGFILFRKFKYLLMAEDKFLDYDYVIFLNGDLECVKDVIFDEIDPKDNKISGIAHPYEKQITKIGREMNKGSCSSYHEIRRLQASFISATSKEFLILANRIESMRMLDKSNGVTSSIDWHDESYYNSYINSILNQVNVLDSHVYAFPVRFKSDFDINKAKIIARKKPDNVKQIKGSYKQFRNDLY